MPDFDRMKYKSLKVDIEQLTEMLSTIKSLQSNYEPVEYRTRIVYYSTLLEDRKEDLKEMKKQYPWWVRIKFW